MTQLPDTKLKALLTPVDPHPVEIKLTKNANQVLVVCDHAGRAVPQKLLSGMPEPEHMERHIAIDVGARNMAQVVASELGSNLIMQRYSRLVIDMNRPLDSDELCPEVSDGTLIPFNQGLNDRHKSVRVSEIFETYHNKVSEMLDTGTNPPVALIAIHSFTPKLHDQPPREWHADLISRKSVDLALDLKSYLETKRPGFNFGVNEIFGVSDKSDYTLRTHAETRGLLGLSIEVRNDLLASDAEITNWGRLLADGLRYSFSSRVPGF